MEGKLKTMARLTAFVLALLAFGAALLTLNDGGATEAAQAAKPCWKQVHDDWADDQVIDRKYPARCINEAIEKVPEDVRAYTDFVDQAERARAVNSRSLQSTGGGNDDGSASGGPSSESQPPRENAPETAKDEGPIGSVLGAGNNDADSLPLPLLILLALAGALITAGAVGFGHRKLQAARARR